MTSGCYSLFFYNFSCLEFGFYLSGIAAARELQPGRADKVVKKHYDVLWRVDFERGLFLEGQWAFSVLTDSHQECDLLLTSFSPVFPSTVVWGRDCW